MPKWRKYTMVILLSDGAKKDYENRCAMRRLP